MPINNAVLRRWLTLLALVAGCSLFFVLRTALAQRISLPRTFEWFETLTVLGSLAALALGFRRLTWRDGAVALAGGLLIGGQMPLATLFSPYPFFGAVNDPLLYGLVRGLYTMAALLGGLVILRSAGPVQVRLANGEWRKALKSLGFGLLVGVPLAVLNMFANQFTQGRPFDWQSPWAAALDALQPAVYEDVVFRLAFLGLLWWVLRPGWGASKAALWAGLLATLVHGYAHMDDLFLSQPLAALGMGAVMALIWGAPMTLLATRRDLESSIAFHWIQDALRFWAGF
ncbi:MAG TPA: hypothetical protein PKW33_19675 [Anaerolineaceae bacterium]|nr:hypothetical protein [Anaerolineaceae bacterium]HPN53825.1 hypothetical protein [Anaerolineaceae bacterium]